MLKTVANKLKIIAIQMDLPEGDVKKKFYTEPVTKAPRRNPSIDNKSNRTDYMQHYMQEYRGEGKDYQKVPTSVKELRKKQRQRLRKKLMPKKEP